MDSRFLILALPLMALGACSGTVGDDLATEELAQFRSVSYAITGMS